MVPPSVSDNDPRVATATQYVIQLATQKFELTPTVQPATQPGVQPVQPNSKWGKTDIDLTYHAKAILPKERDVPLKGVYVFIGYAFGPSYGGVGTTMTWGQRATQQLLLLFANGVVAKTDLKGDNLAGHHQVGCEHVGTRGAQRGLERVGAHGRVRIEECEPFGRRFHADALDVIARMDTDQLLDRGAGCVVVHEKIVQATPVQLVFDRAEAGRLLGMSLAHVVQATGGMGYQGDGHALSTPCGHSLCAIASATLACCSLSRFSG